jgi:hypothetical protein
MASQMRDSDADYRQWKSDGFPAPTSNPTVQPCLPIDFLLEQMMPKKKFKTF